MSMNMRRAAMTSGLLLAIQAGCGDSDAAYESESLGVPIDEDLPSYNCAASDTTGGTDPTGGTDTDDCDTDGTSSNGDSSATGTSTDASPMDECTSSEECDGGSCVAPFDMTRGLYACEFVCVADLDDTRWCADDAACCGVDATCTHRGYCVVE